MRRVMKRVRIQLDLSITGSNTFILGHQKQAEPQKLGIYAESNETHGPRFRNLVTSRCAPKFDLLRPVALHILLT